MIPTISIQGSARQDHDSWTAALKLTVTSMVGVLLREGDFVSFLIFDLNAELDFLTFN